MCVCEGLRVCPGLEVDSGAGACRACGWALAYERKLLYSGAMLERTSTQRASRQSEGWRGETPSAGAQHLNLVHFRCLPNPWVST